MRVIGGPEFNTWFKHLTDDKDRKREYQLALALLAELRDLQGEPSEESATFKRVRQAKRYPVWRVAHPYEKGFAVRVIAWFPSDDVAVVALIGGNKAAIGDLWYDSAVVRAESEIDAWKRDKGGRGVDYEE